MKAMWKWAFGLLIMGAIAFATLPQFRAWIIASSPILLFLLCPLHLIYCMVTMKNKEHSKSVPEAQVQADVADTAPVTVPSLERPRG